MTEIFRLFEREVAEIWRALYIGSHIKELAFKGIKVIQDLKIDIFIFAERTQGRGSY